MTAAAAADGAPAPLLGPGDPPPFEWHNETGSAPALLLADHASNRVPAALGRLGLDEAALGLHVAYDIGIAWVTRRLAELLDAPALLHGYSRLVLDPNRQLDDPTAISAISDGIVVPANRRITEAEAERRADAVYWPYHDAIEAAIRQRLDRGSAPSVISMHSFTPHMRGVDRPWHIGVLWAADGRIAVPLIEALRQDPALYVGDNQPYDARNHHGYTLEAHAMPRGLPNVLIEIRQDLIDDPAKAHRWAERLAPPLRAILADDGLHRPKAAL